MWELACLCEVCSTAPVEIFEAVAAHMMATQPVPGRHTAETEAANLVAYQHCGSADGRTQLLQAIDMGFNESPLGH